MFTNFFPDKKNRGYEHRFFKGETKKNNSLF